MVLTRRRACAPLLSLVREPSLAAAALEDGEVIRIPAIILGQVCHLVTTMLRPARTDACPLIVINHGTSPYAADNQERKRFLTASRAFVANGFAVAVPMRRGYGGSEGSWVPVCGYDLTGYGQDNALDIKGAIQFLRAQSYVDPKRIVVVGQSTGGLATMAYLSMADHGVLGGINFQAA